MCTKIVHIYVTLILQPYTVVTGAQAKQENRKQPNRMLIIIIFNCSWLWPIENPCMRELWECEWSEWYVCIMCAASVLQPVRCLCQGRAVWEERAEVIIIRAFYNWQRLPIVTVKGRKWSSSSLRLQLLLFLRLEPIFIGHRTTRGSLIVPSWPGAHKAPQKRRAGSWVTLLNLGPAY